MISTPQLYTHVYKLGMIDNITLSIIAIKFQYRNRDISESESCDASHVFGLQRWQKAISSFYLLKVEIVLYGVIWIPSMQWEDSGVRPKETSACVL